MSLFYISGFHIFITVSLKNFFKDTLLIIIVINGEVTVVPPPPRAGHSGHYGFLGQAKFQQTKTNRMESSHPAEAHPAIQKLVNTFLHFASGLIGKGHRQNTIGLHIVGRNEMGYLIGNATGFSRTSTSENQHGSLDFLGCSSLFRIQFPVQHTIVHNICHLPLLTF